MSMVEILQQTQHFCSFLMMIYAIDFLVLSSCPTITIISDLYNSSMRDLQTLLQYSSTWKYKILCNYQPPSCSKASSYFHMESLGRKRNFRKGIGMIKSFQAPRHQFIQLVFLPILWITYNYFLFLLPCLSLTVNSKYLHFNIYYSHHLHHSPKHRYNKVPNFKERGLKQGTGVPKRDESGGIIVRRRVIITINTWLSDFTHLSNSLPGANLPNFPFFDLFPYAFYSLSPSFPSTVHSSKIPK